MPAKLRAGLIGCGGRGTSAVFDYLVRNEDVELTAMGDIFADKIDRSIELIRTNRYFPKIESKFKVDPDHRFVGFDAYRKVLASDIDVALLCATPAYRPLHFEAAVAAEKHIFAEKPFGVDPVGARRILAASRLAEQKKLTVMSGAHRRSQREYLETLEKIRQGAIGEMVAAYGWWYGAPIFHVTARDPKWNDVEWTHRNWYSYSGLGGDQIVEQHMHNIDVVNWFTGMHPVSATGSGGAAWRPAEERYGNTYDHMTCHFVYPNGLRLISMCRQYPGQQRIVGERITGTKSSTLCDALGARGIAPKVQEHIDMVKSIRGEGPYINHGVAVAETTLTCIMGREAAYSGQEVTWEQVMASKLDLGMAVDSMNAPVRVPPRPVPGSYRFI